jgi:serine/threonine protein kinase/Tol biopolymer transport system component
METERWQQVDSLLQAALERPPEEREAFLCNACGGDLALEEEVRSLLSAHQHAGSFLESPAVKAAAQIIPLNERREEDEESPRSLVGGSVSHYRILRKLGAGGMGEVYRAHDAVLKRDVAIKILPTYVAQDADRLRRFEQEAQAAAGLNHPNILAVYEFGAFEGVPYLVSEFLEGQTLRQLLRRGPVQVRKAIDYSVQIARGLAAAHEKGIVHRDLKPENLFVSKDGHVKILDFGLAKLTHREPEATGVVRPLSHDTDPGVVVGTPGYMAPEQVRRRPADHRTDIFAFGATLYEMLSGKRAFQGATSAETMTAILNNEPPSISQVAPSAPPGLHRVVHRCLEKNPDQRFQSASDLAFAIEALSDPTSTAPPARTEQKLRPRTSRTLAIAAACCACALLLAVVWLVYKKWHASPAPPVQRALTRVTFEEGLQTGATWSPDGRFIAYSSDRGGKFDIWVQQISGGDPIQVTHGPDQNWQPDWSPDGKYIAYRSEEGHGGIFIAPALGGAGQQRKIAPFGYLPRWSPDSSRILFQSAIGYEWKKVYVVGLDGGPPREVLTDLKPRGLGAVFAAWHPDGKRITAWTFDAANAFPISSSAIPNFTTEPVDGGQAIESRFPPDLRKKIEAAEAQPGMAEWRMDFRFAWAPTGKAVFFERSFHGARNVWRMTVDPVTLQPTNVERLTTSPGIDAELAISPDGSRLAITGEHQQLRAWAFPFDSVHGRVTGPGAAVTSAGIEAWALNLSRDGKKLGVGGNRDGQLGTWEVSGPNGREKPLVAGDSYIRDNPIWSPDGKRAAYGRAFQVWGKGQFVVWSSDNRSEEPISEPICGWVQDWSPDGKSVLAFDLADHGIWQFLVDPPLPGKFSARRILADPNYDLYQPHFSPDGKWIVFLAAKHLPDGTDPTLYAVRATGGPWIPITDGKQLDDKPRWSPGGKTIYFLSYHRGFFNLWGVYFDPVKGRPRGEPFQVTSFETPTLMIPRHIVPVEISLTDRRLALPLAQTSGNIWILDNVDK